MRRLLNATIFFCTLLCTTLSCAGEQVRLDSPEALARHYWSRMQQVGIAAVAEVLHTEDQHQFKQMFVPILEGNSAEIEQVFGLSPRKLRKLKPAEFVHTFLEIANRKMDMTKLRFAEIDYLGELPEGEMVHAVMRFRVQIGEMTISDMEVLSMKREGDEWRLLLGSEIEGLAQAMRQSMLRSLRD